MTVHARDDPAAFAVPEIAWGDVARELERQGLEPAVVVAEASAALAKWAAMSAAERKRAYVYPRLAG